MKLKAIKEETAHRFDEHPNLLDKAKLGRRDVMTMTHDILYIPWGKKFLKFSTLTKCQGKPHVKMQSGEFQS